MSLHPTLTLEVGHSGRGHEPPRALWRTTAEDILALVDRVDIATTDLRT